MGYWGAGDVIGQLNGIQVSKFAKRFPNYCTCAEFGSWICHDRVILDAPRLVLGRIGEWECAAYVCSPQVSGFI